VALGYVFVNQQTLPKLSKYHLVQKHSNYKIAEFKNYNSLIPLAQAAQKPIFELTSQDGVIGGHIEYSCAVTPQIRQTGNRLSGLAGTAYASLLA